MSLNEQLIKLGLTKNESKIYLFLIGKKSVKAGQILNEVDIASGKIYQSLGSLRMKGLISVSIENKVKHFRAASVEKIYEMIKEKENELSLVKKKAEELVPILKKIENTGSEEKSIELYTGVDGFKSSLNKLSENIQKGENVLVLGVTENRNQVIVNTWYNLAENIIHTKKCSFSLIYAKKEISKASELNGFETRYFPTLSLAPITITSNCILINDYDSQQHILIINKNIAKLFKNMFDGFWKLADKM